MNRKLVKAVMALLVISTAGCHRHEEDPQPKQQPQVYPWAETGSRLSSISDSTGVLVTFAYDASGRPLRTVLKAGNRYVSFSVGDSIIIDYTYSTNKVEENIVLVNPSSPSGNTYTYILGPNGYAQYRVRAGSSPDTITYTYDPAGNLDSM